MYGFTYAHWREVIGHTDQLKLWGWILADFAGILPIKLGERFCNPMRQDKQPGCYLDWGHVKKNYIVLNDWAVREFHGYTALDAIMYLKRCSFFDAVDIVANEFLGVHQTEVSGEPISFTRQAKVSDFKHYLVYAPRMDEHGNYVFTEADRDYWQPYGISSEQLLRDQVYPVYYYRHNSKSFPDQVRTVHPPDVCYALSDSAFEGRCKIYRPRQEGKLKWRTNCKQNDVGFSRELVPSEGLIITKSYKDARVLRNLGMQAVWIQSEGTLPLEWIAELPAFSVCLILFDNDETGRRESERLKSKSKEIKGDIEWLSRVMPGEDDVAEFYKKHGARACKSTVLDIL